MSKNTVIYHSADFDGLFSREVAKKFLPQTTTFIGWDYGDPVPTIEPENTLYMIDISVEGLMDYPNLQWLDHHRSAIDKYPKDIQGYRIDGVAACRLAWQYFLKQQRDLAGIDWPLPDKVQFDDRKVEEPFALTIAGEYDVWVHKGDGSFEFQYGLDSQPELDWRILLQTGLDARKYTDNIIRDGAIAMRCYQRRDAAILNSKSHLQNFEGLKFLSLNTSAKGSQLFGAKDVPETGHDALMAYSFDGKKWNFSLYHAKHNKIPDLSLIASKYGGGGHKGACGFQVDKLPF